MDIRKFLVTQEKSTDSVEAGSAAQESVDSVEGATTPSVTSSSRRSSSYLSGTFPNDLPVLVSIIHKQDILVNGPTWYDAKEAQGWLEYSIESDKMYCFVCRLFESEVRERNESSWISIGICNWKKALEKK